MELYMRSAALVLLAVILTLVISRQSRDMSILLSLGVCVIVMISCVSFLSPIIEFIRELRRIGDLEQAFLGILLKCVGVGLLSELAALICADAGENAMGKSLQILSGIVIVWLSLPLMKQVIVLLEEVLGHS